MPSAKPNKLAGETSPYLLQHAHNPVNWYPWGETALGLAIEQDRPILLSIGYSACHWCHVMAHESFEDPDTAAYMNDHFVNIKVDREERPDIDRIYQTTHSLLSERSGGWPLTVFLTPRQIPFFAGTYFPRLARYGLPGFRELLQRIASIYQDRRHDIDQQNRQLMQVLHRLGQHTPSPDALNAMTLDRARADLSQRYDPEWGGFERAPKFPHPTSINRLLRHWSATRITGREDKGALDMALHTLERMAEGGLFDHLGGGFSRYSVDERWEIPHFEKMLYDNGTLLALYAQAYAITGRAYFRSVAESVADWAIREMQSPTGGYYSSIDADSEGHEGRYYIWKDQEIRNTIGEKDYPLFAARYGLDRPANFENAWHLVGKRPLAEVSAEASQDEATVTSRLRTARQRLLEQRETRVHPGVDDKILTAWNGLMIRGMAVAARFLKREEYVKSAERALGFIRQTLWVDGRLLATCKEQQAHLGAYLDDYAFLLDALLEMLQLRWNMEDIQFACALADILLEYYEDQEHGGFYFTSSDHETLIQRNRPMGDEAMPSGYGVATLALIRLGHLVGEPRYLAAAERALTAASGAIAEAPSAHCTLLDALEEQLSPTAILILRGPQNGMNDWLSRGLENFAPARLVFAIPNEAANLPQALEEKPPSDEPTAYYCRGTTCGLPLTELEELSNALACDEPAQPH